MRYTQAPVLRSHIQRSCSYKSAVRLSLRSARAFKLLPAQVPSRCAGDDRGHGHAGHCARVRSACSHVVLACYGNSADGYAHLRRAVSKERAASRRSSVTPRRDWPCTWGPGVCSRRNGQTRSSIGARTCTRDPQRVGPPIAQGNGPGHMPDTQLAEGGHQLSLGTTST